MSKISFILRPANKLGENPVSLVHTHQGSTFTKATGVKIPANCINLKTGKVVGLTQAPEYNADIQRIVTDVETAVRNVLGKGGEPTKELVAAEYDLVVAHRERVTRIQPKLRLIHATILDDLRAELADLEAQVVAKRAEIDAQELAQGIFDKYLLTTFTKRYVVDRASTLKENSKFSFNTLRGLITRFRPLWRIDQVNQESLRAFQQWLVDEEKTSATIKENISKLKQVVRYYRTELALDLREMSDFKLDFKVKKPSNPIYLTQAQLLDLIALDLSTAKPDHQVVRDQFVLMCLTGLRFGDSYVTQDDVKNGHIDLSNEKTDFEVVIPMAEKVKEIMTRYPDSFPKICQQSVNRHIKTICKLVPSIASDRERVTWRSGANVEKKTVSKDQLITCHVARKTMINLALEKGINPKAIAALAGHSSTKLIMDTYGNAKAGRERIMELLD